MKKQHQQQQGQLICRSYKYAQAHASSPKLEPIQSQVNSIAETRTVRLHVELVRRKIVRFAQVKA